MTGTSRPFRNGTGPALPGDDPVNLPAVSIVPLQETDAEAAAELYTRVFLEDEPTTVRHAPDPARFLPFARRYVQWLAGKDLSYVAKDAQTGRVLGFIFCFDFLDDPAEESPALQEFILQFRHAVAMIDELEARHISRDSVAPGSVLHIFQIGVDRQGRRQGIAEALVRRILARAKERGFARLVADCTNPASERLFAQCGFFRAGFSSYDTFCRDGSCFFAGLEGGISLMIRDTRAGPRPSGDQ